MISEKKVAKATEDSLKKLSLLDSKNLIYFITK